MRLTRALALVALVVTPLAACSNDSSEETPTRAVVGAEEFPKVLNNLTIDGATAWTGWATGPALARGYRLKPDFTYEPWLFQDDCSVDSEEPFTVSCRLRDGLKWSDGKALTADDFRFTYETVMNPDFDIATRDGYDRITEFKVVSDTEFQMVFDAPFAAYRDLWAGTSTTVLPEHVLAGEDFDKVWNDCVCDPKTKEPIGSGPFLVTSFTPDQEITLVANDSYFGSAPQLDEVVFVPTGTTESEITGFRGDDFDVIYPQNDADLRKQIEAVDGATYESSLGPVWEHLDLLVTVPGLDDLAVRKAIATALPRQQIVETLVRPANDEAQVLDNSLYVVNQKEYVPNWDLYPAAGDLDAANQLLDAAGWVRDGDGPRRKGDVTLSFTLGTTSGDRGRELAEQIIQEQLAKIGIDLEISNSPDILDTRLISFDYQTILYAFVGTPDPFGANSIYLSTEIPQPCTPDGPCDSSGQNFTRQSNATVDALLIQASSETEPEARAALINTADREMAQNVVSVIPLYQKPSILAWRAGVKGLTDNATVDGFTWNIEAWEQTD